MHTVLIESNLKLINSVHGWMSHTLQSFEYEHVNIVIFTKDIACTVVPNIVDCFKGIVYSHGFVIVVMHA